MENTLSGFSINRRGFDVLKSCRGTAEILSEIGAYLTFLQKVGAYLQFLELWGVFYNYASTATLLPTLENLRSGEHQGMFLMSVTGMT